VAVVFAYEVALLKVGRDVLFRLAAGVGAVVREVVVGVDVLKQTALFKVADPAGLPVGVELMSERVGAGVERVVVLGFVYADAPDENGRVGGIITVLFKNGIYELCAAFSYDNRISAFR